MTTPRLLIAIILTLGISFTALPAEAQSASRLPRVGSLGNSPLEGSDPLADGLRALGWVDGQNVIIERQYIEGAYCSALFHNLPPSLIRNVDVIVAFSSAA